MNSTSTETLIGVADAPEQLMLLVTPDVPLQFRLDERTRRSGLQHIATLRAQLAAQKANREAVTSSRRRPITASAITAKSNRQAAA